jgi:hypothetical protein
MTDTRAWKKITGRQGDWNARVEYDDGSIEELACVHDRFWREGRAYHDPWEGAHLRNSQKFQKHLELMRSKQRVVMTSNKMDRSRLRGHGAMKRLNYRGVFNIKDFISDENGTRFTINGGVPKSRKV